MGALDIRQPNTPAERPATGPGRELGMKRKPQLRLGLGYRDEAKRGAPVKTDYFVARGNDVAVAKFHQVYGQQPNSVNVRLPGSLGGFLDIRHVAFAGGQNDGGGVLKAIGRTNFALEGTLGGPDMLTVWNAVETGETDRHGNKVKELVAEEVWIDSVDDPAASELGVYLQATVTFGIPDVLGFGGVCELRSRGKETIDTLWLTAVDIYGTLGARASLLLRPKLILKESSMMTPRGQKAQLWVVDLLVPESLDEIVQRAREMNELMPGGPTAALYGPEASDEVASPPSRGEASRGDATPAGAEVTADTGHSDGLSASADPDADDIPFGNTPAGVPLDDEGAPGPDEGDAAEARALAAAMFKPNTDKWPGMNLGQIWESGERGHQYMRWCAAGGAKRPEFVTAVRDFLAFYAPELYHEALAEAAAKEARS